MGHGAWGIELKSPLSCLFSHSQSPVPSPQSPVPNPQSPIYEHNNQQI
ncbi:hypothetical protein ACQFX9_12710 [Aliinostoc sp. HNIBRCY26]